MKTIARTLAILGLTAALAAAPPASAASLNWNGRSTMPPIVAREMPLADFLQALLAPQSVAVIVSPAVSDRVVNGRFSGNPGRVFNSVVDNLSLLPYFDGRTLEVFARTEQQRRSYNLSPSSAERVLAMLGQLRLHDGRFNSFTVVPSSGLVTVSGAKPFVDKVHEVVRSVQLSAAASPQQIAVFPLKHAWAWDVTLTSAGKPTVVPGVATLLRSLLGKAGVATVNEGATPVRMPKLRGQGFAAGNVTEGRAADASAPSDSTHAELDVVPQGPTDAPTVAYEVRANAVIVRDTPDRLPQYAELIKALDVEPKMVELETTIVDVNIDRLDELGINWRATGDNNELRLGTGNEADLRLRGPGVNLVTPIARGLAFSTVRDSGRLIARINLLEANGNARVVSRAQLATLANVESVISSNETAYVRVGGFQEVDLFPVTATTSVRITPAVFASGSRQIVNMVVTIRDGRFSSNTVDQIPSVQEVSLSTHGLVPDSQTFVIGGVRQDVRREQTDKVPLLGDLPFVGALFRSTSGQMRRGERIFLVTPRVLTLAELLARPSAEVQAAAPLPEKSSAMAPTRASRVLDRSVGCTSWPAAAPHEICP
jgi:type III secretion protein C